MGLISKIKTRIAERRQVQTQENQQNQAANQTNPVKDQSIFGGFKEASEPTGTLIDSVVITQVDPQAEIAKLQELDKAIAEKANQLALEYANSMYDPNNTMTPEKYQAEMAQLQEFDKQVDAQLKALLQQYTAPAENKTNVPADQNVSANQKEPANQAEYEQRMAELQEKINQLDEKIEAKQKELKRPRNLFKRSKIRREIANLEKERVNLAKEAGKLANDYARSMYQADEPTALGGYDANGNPVNNQYECPAPV